MYPGPMAEGESGKPWTTEEVAATVERYFDMLIMDVRGSKFVKETVYRELSSRFPARTVGSIGRKMSNISAVLVGLGYPHLRGLPPLLNYQRSLLEAVLQCLHRRSSVDEVLTKSLRGPDLILERADIVKETPIPVDVVSDVLHGVQTIRPFRRNFLELEARNSALGEAGELAVVKWEQNYLHGLGKTRLADRVEHVSQTRGDGLGYDVLSFNASGLEKWIEVKTTKYAAEVPFFVTRRELSVSSSAPENFHLYRLYSFGSRSGAGMYTLPGDLTHTCSLDPVDFEARPRSTESLQSTSGGTD